MKSTFSILTKKIFLCILTITLTSCYIPGSVESYYDSGSNLVYISTPSIENKECNHSGNQYQCNYNNTSSTFFLNSLNALFNDPLVLQLPSGATNFNGFFFNHTNNTSGNLDITSSLSSLAIDINKTLTAEPGTQLVIVNFPSGVPTTGNFSFTFYFNVPPGTTSVQAKPIFTGYGQLPNGSKYYPPLLPCVDNMANAPAINIPLISGTSTINIPTVTSDMGCDNITYNYSNSVNNTGTNNAPPTAIPSLSEWSLLILILSIGGAGSFWIKRRYKLPG